MLFNSLAFLLVFLPIALVLHAGVEKFRPNWRLPLLVLLSFVFYGYWDWRFVPLLAVSILFNWLLAEVFHSERRNWMIPTALVVNLAVLGFFKYFNFFADIVDAIVHVQAPTFDIALPLGISFFTFHHIMYLTDLKARRAPRYSLVRYALYIGFFPQVLAGPLVRWSEIMHQLDERPYLRPDAAERFARGLMLLTVGLSKKVFIGDPLSQYVNPVYQAAASGKLITTVEAWQAALGFTFQIYFDFSGYTDMALGIALLFGVVLPQNFDVPYRAASLQDFWRRWHMTLSRFLRDYLYIALGGNRRGLILQIGALFTTMTLGGLWHGAGATYVVWGMAHGAVLALGLLWRKAGLKMPSLLGWALTFFFVVVTFVLFRAGTFDEAMRIYEAMVGFGPLGSSFKWRSLVIAAAVAMIGPTAWSFVHKLPPKRWVALLFALVFVIILFKLGDDTNYEFIYFQF